MRGIGDVQRLISGCFMGSHFGQAIDVAGAAGCSQMRQLFALVHGLLVDELPHVEFGLRCRRRDAE